MSYIVAGTFSGLLMASICGVILPVILFRLYTDKAVSLERLGFRGRPAVIMVGATLISYPLWVIVGILFSLLYMLSVSSTNDAAIIAYRIIVIAVGIAVVAPIILLLKRMLVVLMLLALIFVADFSFLLPMLSI
jgi:hypothetical protein|tara:strand:- start:245 stop:646 length:402 start_codon:yes stop_codon:yes gene_type:complete